MGIVDKHLADDIDILASELLRREDPEPLELLSMALMGGGGDTGGQDVYVDGQHRGSYEVGEFIRE